MCKIFSISGYFIDDESEFSGYLVTEFDDVPVGRNEDEFFFHGLSEENLKGAIQTQEPVNGEFVVREYDIESED